MHAEKFYFKYRVTKENLLENCKKIIICVFQYDCRNQRESCSMAFYLSYVA